MKLGRVFDGNDGVHLGGLAEHVDVVAQLLFELFQRVLESGARLTRTLRTSGAVRASNRSKQISQILFLLSHIILK
jgi:hypothetical protein